MTGQYATFVFFLFSTVLSVTAAWKSLTTGKAQPASFMLGLQGKQPIVRTEKPFAYWSHTLPWLGLAPLTIVLTVAWIVAMLTWPICSDTINEMCLYASN